MFDRVLNMNLQVPTGVGINYRSLVIFLFTGDLNTIEDRVKGTIITVTERNVFSLNEHYIINV